MYSIRLSNGKTITDLELDGNNYIAKTVIDTSVFDDGLDEVVIIDDAGREEKLYNVKIVHHIIDREANMTHIIIRPKTKEEQIFEAITKALNSNDANITDIQLALAEIYELLMGGKA